MLLFQVAQNNYVKGKSPKQCELFTIRYSGWLLLVLWIWEQGEGWSLSVNLLKISISFRILFYTKNFFYSVTKLRASYYKIEVLDTSTHIENSLKVCSVSADPCNSWGKNKIQTAVFFLALYLAKICIENVSANGNIKLVLMDTARV